MQRGQIVWVNLEDAMPPEMDKLRPAVVLSNDVHNEVLNTVVVVPLSTRPPEIWPLRLAMPKTKGLRKSYAVIPGIRQVNKHRISDSQSVLPASALVELEEACFAYLGE